MTDIAQSNRPATESGRMDRLRRLVESGRTQKFIAALILFNAVTLGLETSDTVNESAGWFLHLIDRLILLVFILEIGAKLTVYRWSFFRSGWNVFDLVIVTIALLPSTGSLSVLRALRILRVLRLLSVVPQMRKVIQALLDAIPGMGSIMAVLVLVFYVSSVLTTKLFGMEVHPQDVDGNMQEWFGTVGRSMYSLFQIMTLESWSMGIVRPTMELYSWSWIFFVPFIVLTSFAVLNLFIAVVVNAMQSQHDQERTEENRELRDAAHADAAAIEDRLATLQSDVTHLRRLLEAQSERRS